MALAMKNASNSIGTGKSGSGGNHRKSSRCMREFQTDGLMSEMSMMMSLCSHESQAYEFSAEKMEFSHSHGEAGAGDSCGCLNEDYPDALRLEIGPSNASVAESCHDESNEVIDLDNTDDICEEAGWNDLTESQLEELVLSNLDAIFRSAIKQIIDCGHTEEIATKAVLRSALCYGSKDTTSNVVDSSLAYIKNGPESDSSKEKYFEDLHQLEEYILAELVCVLRAVRPSLSTGDAMWCLLICDMNVSHACAMDGESLGGFSGEVAPSGINSTSIHAQQPKAESKDSESIVQPTCKHAQKCHCGHSTSSTQPEIPSKSGVPNRTKGKSSIAVNEIVRERESSNDTSDNKDKSIGIMESTKTTFTEKTSSIKIHPSSSKRDYIVRQKSLHSDRRYLRTYSCKGSSRGSKLNGLIMDKKLKPVVGNTASVNLASASARKNKEIEVDTLHNNVQPKFPVNAAVAPALSVADTELSLALSDHNVAAPVPLNSDSSEIKFKLAGIPYDETLGKWIPRNKKDEMVLKLIPRIQARHNQIQEWNEWAKQKVAQATQRLIKDKAELKSLKKEKDEAERLQKETPTLEETTRKKITEMENALRIASRKIERATRKAQDLKDENYVMRLEMERAKLQAVESAASCQEVSKREKDTQMKLQSWDKQKIFLQEELASERHKLAKLQQDDARAKDHYNQTEARLKQEEKATEELLAQARSIRTAREQMEVSAKSKEDTIKSKAEKSLQKYKDDIQNLEKDISHLILQRDSSKIAALRRGIDGGYVCKPSNARNDLAQRDAYKPLSKKMANFDNYNGSGGVKRERECVMCLSEEISVVFLPCAHQAVCTTCNELHAKEGMKDCPSCRATIQRRINVRSFRQVFRQRLDGRTRVKHFGKLVG